MATATTVNTTDRSVETNIKLYKKQIEALRSQLAKPTVVRNPEQTQKIYDQIEDLKRKIEGLTRETRKAVPVSNAPVIGQRQTKKTKRHFTI